MPSVTWNCKYTVFVAFDLLAPSRVTPVLRQDRTLPSERSRRLLLPGQPSRSGHPAAPAEQPTEQIQEVRRTARQQGHIPAPSETRGHGQDTFLQVRVYSSFSRHQNPLFWSTNTMLTPKNDKEQNPTSEAICLMSQLQGTPFCFSFSTHLFPPLTPRPLPSLVFTKRTWVLPQGRADTERSWCCPEPPVQVRARKELQRAGYKPQPGHRATGNAPGDPNGSLRHN